MLSLDLGIYGHSNAETGYRNSTYSIEAVFRTVLDPSSVQIVYRMRSISKSEVRANWSLLQSTWCRGGLYLQFGTVLVDILYY